ncbi:hypothetical protein AB0K89_18985 [Streptomyces cinnamoneus]|uniref:hypothetical protein n=1 Tax=Streptomyces cinnamoneus TaxID=53446 RepID=UPI00342AB1A1
MAGVNVALALFAAITLVYLVQQTEAAERQAEQAEDQTAAGRLDGVYHQLLEWQRFLAGSDNKQLALMLLEGTPVKDVKDKEDKAQLVWALQHKVNFYDYAYVVLPQLIDCAPKDREFVLRGTVRAQKIHCEDWLAWSQEFYSAFEDSRLCEVLGEEEESYGTVFVSALRKIGRCPSVGVP